MYHGLSYDFYMCYAKSRLQRAVPADRRVCRRASHESRLQPVGDAVAYAEAVRGRDALLRVRISP